MVRRVVFCCLAAATAQDRPFRAQTRIVQVPAVITNKNGYSIDGLRAQDFTVLDNGVPQEITVDDFAAGLPPISLVVAIQSSAISKLALAPIRRIAGMIEPVVIGQRISRSKETTAASPRCPMTTGSIMPAMRRIGARASFEMAED